MALEGKSCIVTGASSGIGEAIAVLFASRGASLVLCGRSKSRLEKTASTCNEAARDFSCSKRKNVTVLGDLTDSKVRNKVCQTAVDQFGRIDVLVANAGILGQPVSLENATEEVYDEVMATDVKSVFFLIQNALPWLAKSEGNVVCLSSTASAISGDALIYHMAKASIDHMVRCLAPFLGPKGIRINTVNPSFVQTRLLRSIMPDLASENSDNEPLSDPFTQSKQSLHPLKGRCASADEVAQVVGFLVSSGASFVTGQNLFVDGGITQTCLAFQNN